MKAIIFFTILVVMMANNCAAQDWMNLAPLVSTREDVEKILGKPKQSFDSYALYEVSKNRFSVWYSTGKCRKSIEGSQYKVPTNVMTTLSVRLNLGSSIKSIIPDLSEYTREEVAYGALRYIYTSKDGSTVYVTYPDTQETVSSITIRPSKTKQSYLCKNEDLK